MTYGAVSYTHLDVYKRQGETFQTSIILEKEIYFPSHALNGVVAWHIKLFEEGFAQADG